MELLPELWGEDGGGGRMRLIDADALINTLNEGKINFNADINYIILNAPTVDAVPIVRCKDCKFNYANQIPGDEDVCQLCVELPISKDFFCAYGEKDEEVEE